MIEREEISSGKQRSIVTAMVVSTPFLSRVAKVYQPDLLTAPWAWIADQCIRHLAEHRVAPMADIATLFAEAVDAKEIRGPDVDLIAGALEWMSTEFEEQDGLNIEFLYDVAVRHFDQANLTKTLDVAKRQLDGGNADAAKEAVRGYKEIRATVHNECNPLQDRGAVERAFSAQLDPLFSFPGALGLLLNSSLTRDFLLGIMGPEKSGKTFVAIEMLFRACMHRLNVAMFEVGDLSEAQILKRLYSRIAQRSSKEPEDGQGVKVYDVDCLLHQRDECDNIGRPKIDGPIRSEGGALLPEKDWGRYSPCNHCHRLGRDFPGVALCRRNLDLGPPLTEEAAWAAAQKLQRRMGKKQLKIHISPNFTTSITDMDATLDRWFEEDGFVPDVVLCDYADILAPVDGRKDEQGQSNDTWGHARRVSQERHCLFVLPTQSAATSYDKESQTLGDFSRDKRKYAHVNGMLAINTTEPERDVGVFRLGWLLLREDEFSVASQVACVRSLSQATSYKGGWLWHKDQPED